MQSDRPLRTVYMKVAENDNFVDLNAATPLKENRVENRVSYPGTTLLQECMCHRKVCIK